MYHLVTCTPEFYYECDWNGARITVVYSSTNKKMICLENNNMKKILLVLSLGCSFFFHDKHEGLFGGNAYQANFPHIQRTKKKTKKRIQNMQYVYIKYNLSIQYMYLHVQHITYNNSKNILKKM